MAVVGVAEVLIRPSFSDFQKEIGAMVDKTVPQGSSPKNPGVVWADRIKGGLKTAGGAALVGAGAFLGTALTKGFGRLQAIENAQAKLVGLGHDAGTVETIMGNALGAVKGTAFGLGDAATVAASAVAAGVKPGEDLESVLALVGDAASIAGTDMGSMGAIFNKVAASNKLQMDSINQLHDAGVPALQLVADELGVTAEEASKMASEGKIDFDTFRAAMESGMGGAAQKSGETLQGAFANSMAAIGRFGANLLSGVYPQVAQFFNSFQEWMGPIEEMGTAIGERLGQALAGFTEFLVSSVVPAVASFVEWVRQAWPVLGPLVVGLGTAVSVFMAVKTATDMARGAVVLVTGAWKALSIALTANPFALIVAGVAALVAGLIYAYNNFETFRNIVDAAFRAVADAAAVAWEFLSGVFAGIAGWVTGTVAPAMVHFWQGVMVPAWAGIVAAVSAAGAFLGGIFAGIAGWVTGTLVPAVMGFWQGVMVPAWAGIVAAVQAAGAILGAIFQGVSAAVGVLANMASFYVNSILIPVWSGITTAVQAMWSVVSGILGFFGQVFGLTMDVIVYAWRTYAAPVLATIGTFFANLWAGTLRVVFGFIQAGWNHLINGIVIIWQSVLKPAWDAMAAAALWLWNNALLPAFNAISAGWQMLVNGIVSFWTGVLRPAFTAVGAAASALYSGVLLPAFRGIQAAWETALRGIVNLWTGVLRPAWEAVKVGVTALQTASRNGFESIRTLWDGMINGIRSLWEGKLRPILDSVGRFFTETIPGKVRAGVDLIRSAWKSVANAFRTPINWVLTNVWNNGIVSAFNGVAGAVGSGRRLSRANTIPAFADGGLASPGWALVGERGPELVQFGQSSRVYTASQTRAALRDSGGDGGKSGGGAVAKVRAFISGGLKYIAGKLIGTVDKLITPLVGAMNGAMSRYGLMGGLAGDLVRNVVDRVLSWARREDSSAGPVPEDAEEILVRDRGGVLPPGLSRVLNATGGNEWVFTGAQLQRLDRAVSGGQGVPSYMVVRVGEREFRGYVEDIGDARLASHVAGVRRPVRQAAGL